MKLLFDENLSYRLADRLSDVYPGSAHVRDVGLLGRPDEEIWDLAAREAYVIVSKDSDFFQRAVLFGAPPKVVWLRIGNRPSSAAESILRGSAPTLSAFAADTDAAWLHLPV